MMRWGGNHTNRRYVRSACLNPVAICEKILGAAAPMDIPSGASFAAGLMDIPVMRIVDARSRQFQPRAAHGA